ncbi:MAG: peptidoglycan editing factor PgeF [Pleurocapsa sp.]
MVSNSVVSNVSLTDLHWQWHSWKGLPYLTCNLLSNWQHGFFTRQFYPCPPEELTPVLKPDAVVYRVKQVHGNSVLNPKEIELSKSDLAALASINGDSENFFPDGDGLITDRPYQAVWVASADCNPVLIGDVVTGQVSAVHAGWRGTAQKIVPQAIARFLAHGSVKDNLRIAIGPAIAGQVYQVDTFVAAEVGASVISSTQTKNEQDIIAALKEFPDSPILDDDAVGKVRLDVRRINQIQIEQLDIHPQHIAIAPHCTYQHSDRFFSYRRTGEKKVQWSGIVSN